jgi:hypothetical protein
MDTKETEFDDYEYEMWGGKQSRQSRQKQQLRERQKAINGLNFLEDFFFFVNFCSTILSLDTIHEEF